VSCSLDPWLFPAKRICDGLRMAISAVRTPEARFDALPEPFTSGFGAAVQYVHDLPGSDGLTMAYLH